MSLHWLTALLVLVQFALAELWDFAPRPAHHLMIVAHMSFGILLIAVLLVRVAWRLTPGHQPRAALAGPLDWAARTTHALLYVLLCMQAVSGVVLRWAGTRPLSFFGLAIPSPFAPLEKTTRHLIGSVHDWTAWTIIVLAVAHGAIASFHHFVLRDRVLVRMLPRGFAPLKKPATRS